MLKNVPQTTIRLLIASTIVSRTFVHTDEYATAARLEERKYRHQTSCRGWGEYARDKEGDGFCEVPVHTIEGF